MALTADTDSDVREAAAEALGQLGAGAATPEVVGRLVALTADTDSDVRQAAAGALGQLGAGATTPRSWGAWRNFGRDSWRILTGG